MAYILLSVDKRIHYAKLISKFVFTKKMVSSYPCLPVPPILETLKKLLTSAKPFTTPHDYCVSENIINYFGSPGGEGEYLQSLLLDRADRMDNWLVDWWEKSVYFDNRNPLVMSSAGLSFPLQDCCSDDVLLERASKIAAGALQFKKLIDDNRVSRECIGNEPLDMSQYKKIFGTSRIPHRSCDYLTFNSKSEHMTVAYRNNFYKVTVKEGLGWQKHFAILQQLKEIVKDNVAGPPIGILTSECRDTWYQAYTQLKKNEVNCNSIKVIEDSLFLICLDTRIPSAKINKATSLIDLCIHGDGPRYNATNRWFDKTLQFIVGPNGETGIAFEQSPAEIQVILMVMNFICTYMDTALDSNVPSQHKPEKLNFEIDCNIEDRIYEAQYNYERLVANLDLYCFKFNPYGKEFFNSHQISADSYVQMAIQLAYYRLHRIITPQFQITSIRQFKDGRNELIRCCSDETARFVGAMECSSLTVQSKANALYTAIKYHQGMVNEVINGKGIDNHLFGLRVVASEDEQPEPRIFCTPAYLKSSGMNLCTYQMNSKFDGFAAKGPPSSYGYTCFYKLGAGYINFTVSTYRCSQKTNSYLFGQFLACSLNDMRNIIEQAPSRI